MDKVLGLDPQHAFPVAFIVFAVDWQHRQPVLQLPAELCAQAHAEVAPAVNRSTPQNHRRRGLVALHLGYPVHKRGFRMDVAEALFWDGLIVERTRPKQLRRKSRRTPRAALSPLPRGHPLLSI